MAHKLFYGSAARLWFAITILLAGTCSAATYQSLYIFNGGFNGGDPATALVFDQAGNAYGTTVIGGESGCGTVFRLSPSGDHWQQTVLYSFTCFDDGKNPYGGVTLDAAGNLYGTTVAGGSGGACTGDGCGVIFKLNAGSYSESVLYNFTGGNDGFGPGSAVILDRSGNLYGTTPDGGAYGAGVVYELSPSGSGWSLTVLHAFTGGSDGGVGSLGPLLLDRAGNLNGVTEIGGDYGAGTAYRLSLIGGVWKFTTLYQFRGQPDAAFPYGGLIADSTGALYGSTYYGGTNGVGAVYKLYQGTTPGAWKEIVLYNFQAGSDGSFPTSTLVFDAAKNLYGTTSMGGDLGCDCGTIFKLALTGVNGSHETILHAFSGSQDGANPYYGLSPDAVGNLYGTTVAGGIYSQGIVFTVVP